jgi:GTP:adenosylcobinamide-phosphate guanylyltransferase
VPIPAIVTAGDGAASRAVYGDNKVFLEIEDRPLVVRVVAVLQRVPEVSEVWVVGNAERLRDVFAREDVQAEIEKPLHIVRQQRNLYENAWQTFRRLLPDAGPEGRDPVGDERTMPVLFLSGDLPFATPQEISEFIRRSLALECDYTVGLVPSESLEPFRSSSADQPGIDVAYFNLREGCFRQSNLHLARPALIGNRKYIEDMYEHRYQKQFWHVFGLAWTILVRDRGLHILYLYALIHLAGVMNRRGHVRLANFLRRFVPIAAVERAIGSLLDTRYHFVVTEAGGCAIDIDREDEYETAKARYSEWHTQQTKRAQELYGPPGLPAGGAE